MCACEGKRPLSSVLLNGSLPYYWRKDLSLNPELIDLAKLVGEQAPGICPSLPSTGTTGTLLCPAVYVGAGC